jgi:hypothetical protein
MKSPERSEKYKRDVLDKVVHYLEVNKESSTGMIYIPSLSISTLEGGIRSLYLAGQLLRRQVCLAQGSSRMVWVYRLTHQPESLITYERSPSKYVPCKKDRNPEVRAREREARKEIPDGPFRKEKPHYTILRMLPVPRFEGYQELEQEAA